MKILFNKTQKGATSVRTPFWLFSQYCFGMLFKTAGSEVRIVGIPPDAFLT